MSVLVTLHPDMVFDERSPNDFYPTPLDACRAALSLLPADFTPSTILDPGAGAGPWGKACREKWPDAFIVGVEYRQSPKPDGYNAWVTGRDFLTIPAEIQFDLVIGNPPYGVDINNKKDKLMAEKFVRHGLKFLSTGGFLMYLLLLNFFTTAGRVKGLFQEYPLWEVVPYAERPSFKPGKDRKTGKIKEKGTDQREYSIFIWREGYQTQTYKWLFWKPKPVRKNGRTRKPANAPTISVVGDDATRDVRQDIPSPAGVTLAGSNHPDVH